MEKRLHFGSGRHQHSAKKLEGARPAVHGARKGRQRTFPVPELGKSQRHRRRKPERPIQRRAREKGHVRRGAAVFRKRPAKLVRVLGKILRRQICVRSRFPDRRRRQSQWQRTEPHRDAGGHPAGDREKSHLEKPVVPRVRGCRRNHRRRGKQAAKIKVLESEQSKNFLGLFLKKLIKNVKPSFPHAGRRDDRVRENALLVTGARKRVQGNFRLRVFRVPDISGKQDLPRLAVLSGRKSYRDPLQTGRRGRIPGSHRELLEKHQQSNRSGRLCKRTRHKKQDERDRQACFSRPSHRPIDDSHHAKTNERRETLQDERQ